MDERDRAQRVVGLKAIEAKAKEMADQGADALEVRTFIKGARGELARQKPDWQQYAKAAAAAEGAQSKMYGF
jgi:hypothetical protein